MKKFAIAAALVALVPLGAAEAKPASKDRACFHASNVSGFRAPDDKTVYVRVGVRDVYQMEMMGSCPQIDWAEKIGIRTRGSEFICSGRRGPHLPDLDRTAALPRQDAAKIVAGRGEGPASEVKALAAKPSRLRAPRRSCTIRRQM